MSLSKQKFPILILIVSALWLGGCSSSETKDTAGPTAANVKKSVAKRKTSQSEIVQLLGSPNIVTKNSKGREVWTYTRQPYDTETGGFGGGLVVLEGAKQASGSGTSRFDLILTFDPNDVVEDYSVVQSQF